MFVENANISNEPKMALERNPNGRRWSKDIVRLCLILSKSKGYNELRGSNFLIWPSQNLLRKYNNSVHQAAGVNKDMLEWTANEAKIKNIPRSDFRASSLMKCPYNQTYNLRNLIIAFNWLDLLNVLQSLLYLTKWKTTNAKKLLLLMFSNLYFWGFTGFRFPFA